MKVRISVKKKENEPISVVIHTEFIKLQDLLKYADIAPSGGMAKVFIQDGLVSYNGEICTMRGKKVFDGDVIGFDNGTWIVKHADS